MVSESTNDVAVTKIVGFSEDLPMEQDLPPEYCHYWDDGCESATAYLGHQSSCLNCPFPKCIYDEPGGRQHWLKRQRDREVARLFSNEGKEVKELALMFGVSQRTVQRALKNYLSASLPKETRKWMKALSPDN